jgi:hypothetical protein
MFCPLFLTKTFSSDLQPVWLEGVRVKEWELARRGTKNALIGSWAWEFRREEERELRTSTPANLLPGSGQVIQTGLGNWRNDDSFGL